MSRKDESRSKHDTLTGSAKAGLFKELGQHMDAKGNMTAAGQRALQAYQQNGSLSPAEAQHIQDEQARRQNRR